MAATSFLCMLSKVYSCWFIRFLNRKLSGISIKGGILILSKEKIMYKNISDVMVFISVG